MTSRTRALTALAAFGLLLGFVGTAQADDKVAGTWSWTQTRNDQEMKYTLTLKQDGDKLTGKLTSPRGDADITDGKADKDGISFKVTREFNGNQFTQTYKGKVDGDKLKLTVEFERNGEKQTRDIEAKREADKA